jgi:sulfopyruvate decarboxylase subunit alpha
MKLGFQELKSGGVRSDFQQVNGAITSMKTGGDLVAEALVAAGINFICTLPDWNMARLIERISQENSWIHVRLAREEEGVGICAGAYLTGKTPTPVMQNGGLLNSANGLTTTSLQFGIPTLLVVYYAGDINTRYFSTVGDVTEPVLQALGIRHYVLRDREAVMRTIVGATVLTMDSRRPVAVLLNRDLLRSES